MFPDPTRDDVFRIETRRLWLRWPKMQDAAAIARIHGDPDVAAMTGVIPHPFPAGAAERFVFEERKANATGQRISLAIAPRARPEVYIGRVGSRMLPVGQDGRRRCSLGYWLDPAHWGKGFATEAAQGVIDTVFAYTEIDEIEASVRVINPPSRRVQEKCGFQFQTSQMMDLPELKGGVPVDTFLLRRSTWASLKDWRGPRIGLDQHEARPIEACA
jgi:RimJ/RimL family protein N-acetyltransferase